MSNDTTPSNNIGQGIGVVDVDTQHPGTSPINIQETISIGSDLPPQELLVEASRSIAPSYLSSLIAREDSIQQISNLALLNEAPSRQVHVYEADTLMQPQCGFKHVMDPADRMWHTMDFIYEDQNPWRRYPPPPNAAYTLDSQAHDPKLHYKGRHHNAAGFQVRDCDSEPSRGELLCKEGNGSVHKGHVVELVQGAVGPQETTKGEMLAQDIKFDRISWVMATPGVSGMVLPPAEQREEFISNIDKKDDKSVDMEMCSKCGKAHILPGPPITLADRDTCFSQLPDWFPRKFDDPTTNPWDAFRQLLTLIVFAEEVEKGYKHMKDSTGPEWNLQFHEKGDDGWTTDHARKWGGWWKCRSGENAPEAERKCRLCHRAPTAEEERKEAIRKKTPSFAAQKQSVYATMDGFFKEQGRKDKEAALEMLRRDGIPQYLGPPIDDAAKNELFQKQALLRARSIPDIVGNLATMRSSAHVADVEAEVDREEALAAESQGLSSSVARFSRPIVSFFL